MYHNVQIKRIKRTFITFVRALPPRFTSFRATAINVVTSYYIKTFSTLVFALFSISAIIAFCNKWGKTTLTCINIPYKVHTTHCIILLFKISEHKATHFKTYFHHILHFDNHHHICYSFQRRSHKFRGCNNEHCILLRNSVHTHKNRILKNIFELM